MSVSHYVSKDENVGGSHSDVDDESDAVDVADMNVGVLHPDDARVVDESEYHSAPQPARRFDPVEAYHALVPNAPPSTGGMRMVSAANYFDLLQANYDLQRLLNQQAQHSNQPDPQQAASSPQPAAQPSRHTPSPQPAVQQPRPQQSSKQFTFQNVNGNGDSVNRVQPFATQHPTISTAAVAPKPMPTQIHQKLMSPPQSAVGIANSSHAAASVLVSNLPTVVQINHHPQHFPYGSRPVPRSISPGALLPATRPAPPPPAPAPAPVPAAPSADWGVPPPSSMDDLNQPFIVGQRQNANAPEQQTIAPTQAETDERDGCFLFVCMTGVCAGLYAFLKCC